MEKGTLNRRGLIGLLLRQLAATALDKVGEEIMFLLVVVWANDRGRVTVQMNARLQRELETGILSGYLELDIPEMKDQDINVRFNEARRLVEEDGIRIFTQQLGIFRECTSIVARIATLASLTSRNSWPILSLTAAIPFFDQLLGMIPWINQYQDDCKPLSDETDIRLHLRCKLGRIHVEK